MKIKRYVILTQHANECVSVCSTAMFGLAEVFVIAEVSRRRRSLPNQSGFGTEIDQYFVYLYVDLCELRFCGRYGKKEDTVWWPLCAVWSFLNRTMDSFGLAKLARLTRSGCHHRSIPSQISKWRDVIIRYFHDTCYNSTYWIIRLLNDTEFNARHPPFPERPKLVYYV